MIDRRSSSYRSAQVGLSLEESIDLLIEKMESGLDLNNSGHTYQIKRLKDKIAKLELTNIKDNAAFYRHSGNK